MGSSYNETWLQGTQSTNASTASAQQSTNESNENVASVQAQAVMDGNNKQYLGQLDQDATEKAIKMEELRVREKEVDNNYKVDLLQAQNDSIRANASMVSANAQQTKADATYLKEVDRHDEKTSDDSSSSNDYWYG